METTPTSRRWHCRCWDLPIQPSNDASHPSLPVQKYIWPLFPQDISGQWWQQQRRGKQRRLGREKEVWCCGHFQNSRWHRNLPSQLSTEFEFFSAISIYIYFFPLSKIWLVFGILHSYEGWLSRYYRVRDSSSINPADLLICNFWSKGHILVSSSWLLMRFRPWLDRLVLAC